MLNRIEDRTVRSVAEAVTAIAKLGGYRPYKNAKPPGVKLLWLGLRRLEAMTEGYRLALTHLKNASH